MVIPPQDGFASIIAEEKKKGSFFPAKADVKSSGLIRQQITTGMTVGSHNL